MPTPPGTLSEPDLQPMPCDLLGPELPDPPSELVRHPCAVDRLGLTTAGGHASSEIAASQGLVYLPEA